MTTILYTVFAILSLFFCATSEARKDALILLDNPASNDHFSVFSKMLSDNGIPYNYAFQNDAAPLPNRIDLDNNILVDSNGAKHDLLIALGGSEYVKNQTAENIRDFVYQGGHYLGICMGGWNASYGHYYGSTPNNKGIGLLGQLPNGSKGTVNQSLSVRGYQFNAVEKGDFTLNMEHPIAQNLPTILSRGAKYYGSGFFEKSLVNYWTELFFNKNYRVIAYNSGFPDVAHSVNDSQFGQTVNGTMAALEYFPDQNQDGQRDGAYQSFGKVIATGTHPEHLYQGYPLLYNMFRYLLWGDSLMPPVGFNRQPIAELSLSNNQIIYQGNANFYMEADHISDAENDNIQVNWTWNNFSIRNNNNETHPLNWDRENILKVTQQWGRTIVPKRILMRITDDGTPRRMSERSRLIAINNDSDGLPQMRVIVKIKSENGLRTEIIQESQHGITIDVNVGEQISMKIEHVGGDGIAGGGAYSFDFGDGSFALNAFNPTKGTYYFVPGIYHATAMLKDNDSPPNYTALSIRFNVDDSLIFKNGFESSP